MHANTFVGQQISQTQGIRMSFPIYLLGSALVIGGVAWGLSIAGVSQKYIMIACLIMLGIAILSGVAKTRMKDPPTT